MSTIKEVLDGLESDVKESEKVDSIFYDLLPKVTEEKAATEEGPVGSIDFNRIGEILGDKIYDALNSDKSAKEQLQDLGADAISRWVLSRGPVMLESASKTNPMAKVALAMMLNSKLTPTMMDLVQGAILKMRRR